MSDDDISLDREPVTRVGFQSLRAHERPYAVSRRIAKIADRESNDGGNTIGRRLSLPNLSGGVRLTRPGQTTRERPRKSPIADNRAKRYRHRREIVNVTTRDRHFARYRAYRKSTRSPFIV